MNASAVGTAGFFGGGAILQAAPVLIRSATSATQVAIATGSVGTALSTPEGQNLVQFATESVDALVAYYAGAFRSARPEKNLQQIQRFLEAVDVLLPDESTPELRCNIGYRIELLSEDLQGDVKKLKDQANRYGSGSDLTGLCSC